MLLAEKVKQKAHELGFQKIGFARAEYLEEEAEKLNKWLSKGFHAGMAWMAREPEKRCDPRLLFPPVKTIISVAMNYYTPYEHNEAQNQGKISRYAWGEDYHNLLRNRLNDLLEFIKTLDPEAEGKICVDTSPILEKAWAVKAGLGWIGKHSNLITKDYGSWVFLGEILINVEIQDETKIEPDHCGSCRACIDACPTGAIVEPYVVNSNLCISYATIESRDPEISEEVADRMQKWLYGCDICQEVCPWNRFQKPSAEEAFKPRYGTTIDLDEIMALGPRDYQLKFQGSPMKRAKLEGLKRNARAIMRKSKD